MSRRVLIYGWAAFLTLFTCCSPDMNSSPRSTTQRPSPTLNRAASTASERTVLPNGLTIITLEDHSAPVVSAQVWAKTGSIHEDHLMGAGLSHILEHMLFKGTDKRGVADIARQVEAHGGYINAYTSWDRTVYYIDIPSDGGQPGTTQGTNMAIDILADAMMNSTLPPQEYLLEQKVILRELAMGRDNPDRQSTELFFSTVYTTHPARHPVIGYEEVYRALSREDVLAYYKERYVPNNLVFIVVGDIQPSKVREQITQLMGAWKRKALPPFYVPDEPEQIGEREVIEPSRTAAQQSRIHLGYQTCDFRSPDAAPLEILSLIAGHGYSSRLYQLLREKKHLVHEVDAWSYTPAWRGVFGVSAVTDPDKAENTRDEILSQLKKFSTTLVSGAELAKAKKVAVSGHFSTLKTMSGQAAELGSNELLTGDLTYSERYLEDLQKVTAQDIRRVARTYFQPERLTVTVLQPKGTPKKVVASAKPEQDQAIERTQLKNGLTLLTKTDHRLPFIELRLVMKSGLLFEEKENNGISQLVSKLLLKGTKTRNAETLVRQIESIGGSISPYSGVNSMGISIEVMESDLPIAMEVLSDIIRNSVFDEESIAREKEAQIAEIHQEQEQPVKVAMLNARAKLFGRHPYGMSNLGTPERVTSITRTQILDFWKRVAVPNNMVLSVFGAVDSRTVQMQVNKHLGVLAQRSLKLPSVRPTVLKGSERVSETQDKEQAVIVIGFPGIDLKNPDRAPIELMNSALSGMGSRLFLRLRDQLALCYYVGVNEMVGIDPGFIYFYIGTEPEKAAEAEKEILSEVEKIRTGGVTPEELERARNGLVGERKMQKQNLGDLALTSALDELYGLGYNYSETLEKAYETIKPPQIQLVAQKYFSQPSVISIVSPKSESGK